MVSGKKYILNLKINLIIKKVKGNQNTVLSISIVKILKTDYTMFLFSLN